MSTRPPTAGTRPRAAGQSSAGRSAASRSRSTRTAGLGALCLVPVSDQLERLPGRFEAVLELSSESSEHARPQAARRFRIAGTGVPGDRTECAGSPHPWRYARDDNPMLRPVHVTVLDPKHLALSAARLERPDDTIVHRGSHELVLGRAHHQARPGAAAPRRGGYQARRRRLQRVAEESSRRHESVASPPPRLRPPNDSRSMTHTAPVTRIRRFSVRQCWARQCVSDERESR